MWADITQKREEMARIYVKSPRHTIQVPYIPFLSELAKLNGCHPNLSMYQLYSILHELPFNINFYEMS